MSPCLTSYFANSAGVIFTEPIMSSKAIESLLMISSTLMNLTPWPYCSFDALIPFLKENIWPSLVSIHMGKSWSSSFLNRSFGTFISRPVSSASRPWRPHSELPSLHNLRQQLAPFCGEHQTVRIRHEHDFPFAHG